MVKGRLCTYMDVNGTGSFVDLCMPFLWLSRALSSKSHIYEPSLMVYKTAL